MSTTVPQILEVIRLRTWTDGDLSICQDVNDLNSMQVFGQACRTIPGGLHARRQVDFRPNHGIRAMAYVPPFGF